MERSLRTVIQERPKCRTLTFCIPFDLPDAADKGARKSARQKFEDRKKSWRQRIPGASRVRIELWSEGDLLERLVGHASQRGIERFFWDREIFSPDWCSERAKIAFAAAGGRYSPELHVQLPVAFSLEGLARSEAYWQKYRALRGAVAVAASKIDVSRYTGLGVTKELRRLVRCIAEWQHDVPSRVALRVRLERDRLIAKTRDLRDKADAAYPSSPRRTGRKARARQAPSDERRYSLQHYLGVLLRAVAAFEKLLRSGASEAAERGALLLTGEAGQGKTHLFCDVAKRAVEADRPAVVILAGRLSGRRVWSEIADQLGLGQLGSEELLGAMDAAAQASSAPFLLLIDALNESDEPGAWQNELVGLLAEVARNPWISLGFSVRSTFLDVVLPTDGPLDAARVDHPGFDGRELEAIERFFDAFGLQQPRVPLLDPEFTNPLFLKLYCESLQGLGLSAPNIGGTHVSEVFGRYLESKAKRIVSSLELDPAGRPVEAAIDAFCKALIEDNRDSLPRDRSAAVINNFAPGRDRWPDTLLGQLLSEGVLTADVAWRRDAEKSVEVVRFTYQRFTDFRVASAFLEPLNGDPAQLRQGLSAGRPLRKRVLRAPAAWAEALAVLVPERFGIELLDATNWRLDSPTRRRWEQAFVQSVSTRRPSAVTSRTRELLSLVARRSRGLSEIVLDTLLAVSPLPEHPLNDALHRNLKNWPMPVRDVVWSIPTYFALEDGGPLDRLIRWAARGPYPDYPGDVIQRAAVPIVWTFTSPNRRMRDYATKALVQLLSGHLSELPALIKRFDNVDDSYVIERLAVVAHGVVLCSDTEDPAAAVAVAGELRRVAFARVQVPNIITRDAVRGIHEWCAGRDLIDEQRYREMQPPYDAVPPENCRSEEELEQAYWKKEHGSEDRDRRYSKLFMSVFNLGDFGRYVIQSKLRNFSNNPISTPKPQRDNSLTYPAEVAKCWVLERVLSLGWAPEKFAEFDMQRANHGRSSHKAERFGKKYQWIAFRELLARIADNFHMTGRYSDQPDGYTGPWQFLGRDIDPTLPAPTWGRSEDNDRELNTTFALDSDRWWIPEGPSYGTDDPPPGEDWATEIGDMPDFKSLVRKLRADGTRWVVLHSHHDWGEKVPQDEGRSDRRCRELWSHVYSWLVRPSDSDALVKRIEERSLMGRWMPEGTEHTDAVYLGELPWAEAAGRDPEPWQLVQDDESYRPTGIEVYPSWTGYHWEGNVLDCSIEKGVLALLPAPVLFEAGRLRWVPRSRTWSSMDGPVVARYDEASGHGALLVREDWLKRVLGKTGYAIVFGWLGEKQLFEAGLAADLVGDWMGVSAVALLAGGRWTFREPQFIRQSIRR